MAEPDSSTEPVADPLPKEDGVPSGEPVEETREIDQTPLADLVLTLADTIQISPHDEKNIEVIDLSSGSESEGNEGFSSDSSDIVFCGVKKFSPKRYNPARRRGMVKENGASTSRYGFLDSDAQPPFEAFVHSANAPNKSQSVPVYGLEAAFRDQTSRLTSGPTTRTKARSGVNWSNLSTSPVRTAPPSGSQADPSAPGLLTPSSSGNIPNESSVAKRKKKYTKFNLAGDKADWFRHLQDAVAAPTDWSVMTRKEIIAAATKSEDGQVLLRSLTALRRLKLTKSEKRHLRQLKVSLTVKAKEHSQAETVIKAAGLVDFQEPNLDKKLKTKLRRLQAAADAKKLDSPPGNSEGNTKVLRKKKKKQPPHSADGPRQDGHSPPLPLRSTDLRFQITPNFRQYSLPPPGGPDFRSQFPLPSSGPSTSSAPDYWPLSAFEPAFNFPSSASNQNVPGSSGASSSGEPQFLDQIIRITDHAYWLLLTERPVIVTGIARVQCFGGAAEIAGYLCKPGSEQIVVPSLECESWLSIHGGRDPVTAADFENIAIKSFDRNYLERCSRFLDRFFGRFTAVLLLTSTNPVTDPVIWHALTVQPSLFPDVARDITNSAPAPFQLWGPHFKPFPGCRLLADDPLAACKAYVPYLDFQKDIWKSVSRELCRFFGYPNPVVFLCGGKNVGKSTTVRFAINYLLRAYNVVQCLDCDIGQSELNAPGCLSLHTFTEPVFGPPFVRLREPTASCYLGEVSPGSIKEYYKKCLNFVYSNAILPEVPLVVNTMGWVEHVGLELLKTAAEMVQPNLIIELTSKENPSVSRELALAAGGRYIYLRSGATVEAGRRKFTPALKRRLSVLMYLSRISPTLGPLNSCLPYAINFADIALFFTEQIPSSRVLVVLLGAYVGLSQMDPPLDEHLVERSGPIGLLRQPPVCRSVGFGVVRAIDVEHGRLYIVTPLSERDLRVVNVVIRGAVSTPDEVFLGQKLSGYSGPVPKVERRKSPND